MGTSTRLRGSGRALQCALMLVGIGLIGVLTATVASFFIDQKTDKLEDRLERMEALLLELVSHDGEMGVGDPEWKRPSDRFESRSERKSRARRSSAPVE